MKKLLLGAILLFSNLCISQTLEEIAMEKRMQDTVTKPKTLDYYLSKDDKFTGEKFYSSYTRTVSIAKFVQGKSSNQYISIDNLELLVDVSETDG